MSALRRAAADYLRMRRALGYKLAVQGWLLDEFVFYLERAEAQTVTIEHAVAWATQPAAASEAYWGMRLSVVREFARHLQDDRSRLRGSAPAAVALPPAARDPVSV